MGFEVAVSTIGVLSAAGPLPININGPTLNVPLELVLDNRVLTLRHATINPIFRIQAALAQGFQSFLIREGFTQVFTPKIVASGTEGGTELFSVQYFDEKAYLCQSPLSSISRCWWVPVSNECSRWGMCIALKNMRPLAISMSMSV